MASRYWGQAYWGSDYWSDSYWSNEVTAATGGYWSTNYWSNRYWQAKFWAGSEVAEQRAYWSASYWHPNYWSSQYWPQSFSPPGATGAYFGEGFFSRDYWGVDYFSFPVHAGDGSVLGTLASDLDGIQSGLSGAVVNPGFYPAAISSALDGLAAQLSGTAFKAATFDVSLVIGPAFVIQEFPGFDADLDSTLGDLTALLSGTFLPVGAIDGSLSSALDALTASIQGAHVRPANRSGAIDANPLAGALAAIDGNTFLPGSRLGQVESLLADVAASLVGTSGLTPRVGTISVGLDDTICAVSGLSLGVGARLGVMTFALGDAEALMIGQTSAGDAPRARFSAQREKVRFEAARERKRFEVQR